MRMPHPDRLGRILLIVLVVAAIVQGLVLVFG